MDLAMVLLVVAVLVLIAGVLWGALRIVNNRLSYIDKELHAITAILDSMPKEISLQEYMFSQDRRLRDLAERLDQYPETDVLKDLIQDQANQVIAFLSVRDADENTGITRNDIDSSLQVTNGLLERVLWSLRFDEDKYQQSNAVNTGTSENQDRENVGSMSGRSNARKDIEEDISMNALLEEEGDDYKAMLRYMRLSGKSGVEAQQALREARLVDISA